MKKGVRVERERGKTERENREGQRERKERC